MGTDDLTAYTTGDRKGEVDNNTEVCFVAYFLPFLSWQNLCHRNSGVINLWVGKQGRRMTMLQINNEIQAALYRSKVALTNWLGLCLFGLYLSTVLDDYYINISDYFEGL